MSLPSRPQVQKLAALSGHRDCVYALAGAPDEDRFFSAGADGLVAVWSLDDLTSDGELVARVENSVYALRYLPERGLLVLGHNFQGIQAIALAERKLLHSTALPPAAIFDIAYSVEQKLAMQAVTKVAKAAQET